MNKSSFEEELVNLFQQTSLASTSGVPPSGEQFDLVDDDDPSDLSLLLDFPFWNALPDEVRRICLTHRNKTLDSNYGLTLYRYSSDEKREELLHQALEQVIEQVASAKDVGVCARILYNYLAHTVQCFSRAHGDANALVWCIADEEQAIHRIVDKPLAVNILKTRLGSLVHIFDKYFLRRCQFDLPSVCPSCQHGNPDACYMRDWNAKKIKHHISDHKIQRDAARGKMNSNKEDQESQIEYEDLFHAHSAIIEHYEHVLMIRTLILGNNQPVVREYLDMCSTKRETLQGNTIWFPCPDKQDVNLETGETRRRWLCHNVIQTANANYTLPLRLSEKMDPDAWSDEDRDTYFGMVPDLFRKISGQDTATHIEIITSLYLQLLGHNHHKYLIFWIGNGNNGKTIILGAFRKIMGPLAEALDKSVFFETNGTVSAAHAGYSMQLVDIRSGTIDELSNTDVMKLDMVKRIVSPEVTLCLREAGARRQGSAKTRYHIECSILMSCNDGSFPRFERQPAMMNRFRVIRFSSQFVAREPTAEEKASNRFYRVDSQLSQKLAEQQVQEQFLNYIIAYGIKYYRSAKAMKREPLPPNEATEIIVKPKASSREASFTRERYMTARSSANEGNMTARSSGYTSIPPFGCAREEDMAVGSSNCRPEPSIGISTRHEESFRGEMAAGSSFERQTPPLETFRQWFVRRTIVQEGGSIPIEMLAKAYREDHHMHLRTGDLVRRIQSEIPTIVKQVKQIEDKLCLVGYTL